MNDRTQSDQMNAEAASSVDQPTSLPGLEPSAAAPSPSSPAVPLQAALADEPPADHGGARSPAKQTVGSSSGAGASKSQRVRDYLRQHPEARNKDVADALAAFGVTAADVANVKSQQKRKEAKPPRAKRRGRPEAQPASAPAAVEKTTSAAASSSMEDLSLSDLEHAIAFVRQIGSIQQARKAVDLLEQIRQIKP